VVDTKQEKPADEILMKHPKLEGGSVATTTRSAFEKVWEKRGWKIVDGAEAASATKEPEAGRTPAATANKEK